MTALDLSHHQRIRRHGNGIQLMRPERERPSTTSISELFKQPFNVYFMNRDSLILDVNESTVASCGFVSREDAVGRTTRCVAKKETYDFEMHHDREVIHTNRIIIKDELYIRQKDGVAFSSVAIKFPWYDSDNKIIGIFGCSLVLGVFEPYSLASALTVLSETGLLSASSLMQQNQVLPSNCIDGVYLTKREVDCLNLLILGKTAKHIARSLNLSPRTVEHYICSIRHKLNVESKSELIDKVRHYFNLMS